MGWNVVHAVRDDPVIAPIDGQHCYFVHSYYADPADSGHVVADDHLRPGLPRRCARRVARGHAVPPREVRRRGRAAAERVARGGRRGPGPAVTFTLYPAVDIREGRAVRLMQGRADAETVYDDDPVAAAERWVADGARWLHVVDLDAAFTGEPRNRHLVRDIVGATGVPVQASGGVRTLDDIEAALGYGASRVVVGTRALEDPDFVPQAVVAFGDAIAIGLDAEGTTLKARGWTTTQGDLFEAVRRFTVDGVARFVVTDISRDGMAVRTERRAPRPGRRGHVRERHGLGRRVIRRGPARPGLRPSARRRRDRRQGALRGPLHPGRGAGRRRLIVRCRA